MTLIEPYADAKSNSLARVTEAAAAPMSKGEREELLKVVRLRARVAKEDADARKAQILAEGEAALARKFSERDAAWADLTREARAYMEEISQKIAVRAGELGIPAAFQPSTGMYWLGRGENESTQRRAELRKVLQTGADNAARAAKLEIDRWSADLQTSIIAGGLTDRARDLLDQLPAAETLMPPLRVPELGSRP
ncbi:hypothetical protein ACFYRL_17535 [Streptomyces goshikiensis]|uniref:hypothetical protein n=1 Tax=Streptomyces TaxID=1883 RepID=UPI0036523B1E